MSIKFYGELFNGRDTASKSVRQAADMAARMGIYILRSNTPVKTGLLASSWQTRSAGRGIQIFNPTPYAIFQEMGTSKMVGRHMIGRSLPQIEQVFTNELADRVGRNLAAQIIGRVSANPLTEVFPPISKPAFNAATKGDRNLPKGIRGRKFYPKKNN